MANGTSGDHPVSDILDHGLPVYGSDVDSLVRQLAELLPRYRLWEALRWPRPPVPVEFERELRTLVARLRQEAENAGWEPPGGEKAR